MSTYYYTRQSKVPLQVDNAKRDFHQNIDTTETQF